MESKECTPTKMTLRDVPCEVLELINRKKIEILQKNKHRTSVSNEEALFKIILEK